MFDLLSVMVRNPGRVLDKDFLLREVWPDSFVEEGNISFNVRQLRKALDDNAQSPIFIETIPRRGYRFIAPVEEVLSHREPTGKTSEREIAPDRSTLVVAGRSFRYSIAAAAVLFVFAAAVSSWYFLAGSKASIPLLASPLSIEKLSTTGVVFGAAISPDGRTVVYSTRSGGKQSVWLRQLDSGNNVELIPPSEDTYYDFVFSPDGKHIYVSRGKWDVEVTIDIFRVSVLGGIPEKVLSRVEGSVSISPDGKRISFVRCPKRDDEWCSLWTADVDGGKNERKLVSRPYPIRIADNEFSPDGTKVAFAVGQSRNQANEFGIAMVDLASGVEAPMTGERFFNIKNLGWLPDASGLLMSASRIPNKHFRIWHLSAVDGSAEPLTKDSEAYSIISLDRSAERLVSTQIKQDFRINVFSFSDPAQKRYLADASRSTFGPDGRVYFPSVMSGNDEIWSINPDGSGLRQLTNNPGGDGHPLVSQDNKTVFFTSNRSGSANIWRMGTDGSDQTQVTSREGGSPQYVTLDGKTLFYRHAIDGTLWSVSLETGEEKLVYDRSRGPLAFAPDGTSFAVEDRVGDVIKIAVISLASGEKIGSIDLPRERTKLLEFAWFPDGRSLVYLMSDAEYEKNAVFQQSLDGGKPRKIADLGDDEVSEISGIAISPDGKYFTVVQGSWKHDAVLITGSK